MGRSEGPGQDLIDAALVEPGNLPDPQLRCSMSRQRGKVAWRQSKLAQAEGTVQGAQKGTHRFDRRR